MKPFVITSVLAPTDLSDSSVPALGYARFFADRFHAKLTVLYADPIVYAGDLGGPAVELFSLTPEHEEALRAQVTRQAAPVMAGRPYDIEVAVGPPPLAIVSAAKKRHADLIIMGTHLRHGWRRALLGSVSDSVIHGSDCPVLTVATRDSGVNATPFAITHVLCPINFTEVAGDSLRIAASVAESFHAELTIVHVIEPDAPNAMEEEARLRNWVASQLQNAYTYRQLVLRGGPAERVLDCAEDVDADFVVIGAQHKLFRNTTVIGATSERVVRFASCPVLVVPRQTVHREVTDAETVGAGELATGARY